MEFDPNLDYRATGVNILSIFASCKMLKMISEVGVIDEYVKEIENELEERIKKGAIINDKN